MPQFDLISCHDCGLLHRKRALAARERARCVRCHALLYRAAPADLERMVALTLGALLVFLIAQFCPIVELEIKGQRIGTTLAGAIGVLWTEQMQPVAAMVTLFTIVFPLVELGALLYAALGLRAGLRPPGFDLLLRAVQTARRWGMTEVLMMGILITVIKMASLARVLPQPGLFAFGALTLMLAWIVSFEPAVLWEIGETLAPPPAAGPAPGAGAAAGTPGAAPLSCHACGKLTPAVAGAARQHCRRCGAALHRRRPDSVNRTWALLIAALILYIPANLLPVMYTHSLFGIKNDTIMSGVVYFWTSGSKGLAVIIFVASVVVPLLKLAVLSLLAWSAQRRSRWRPRQRTALYRLVEFVGRWSMLDIFVVTLTVALARFQSLAVITAGPGALAFGSVVVLTMLASMQFDPRLIWDHTTGDAAPTNGEMHA